MPLTEWRMIIAMRASPRPKALHIVSVLCQLPLVADGLIKDLVAVGGLFVEMVRYRWAANNHGQRPGIDEVLQHPAWGPLLPNAPQAKRRRLGDHEDVEA